MHTENEGWLKVAAFAFLPAVPILLIIIASGFLFDKGFVEQNVSIAKAISGDAGEQLTTEIVHVKSTLETLTADIKNCANKKCDKGEIQRQTAELQNDDVDLATRANAFLDGSRPVTQLGGDISRAQQAVAGAKVALAQRQAAIDMCSTSCTDDAAEPPRFTVLESAASATASSIDAIKQALTQRDQTVANQPGAVISAANATIITIFVAAGAALWIASYVLPRPGTPLPTLRWTLIGISVVVLITLASSEWRYGSWISIEGLEYRSQVTNAILNDTLGAGLSSRYSAFLVLMDVATGFVAAALILAFGAWSIIAWAGAPKSNGTSEAITSETPAERTRIAQTVLYLAALTSITGLLLVSTHFSAASGFFIAKVGDQDQPSHAMVDEIGRAILYSYGIGLGLGLAAGYIPAAFYSQWTVVKAADGSTPSSLFGADTFGVILRFLVILAPPALGTILGKLTG